MMVIAFYMLSLLGVGIYSGRKITDTMDFSIAGRRIGFPLLLGTLIGTSIGAASAATAAGWSPGFVSAWDGGARFVSLNSRSRPGSGSPYCCISIMGPNWFLPEDCGNPP